MGLNATLILARRHEGGVQMWTAGPWVCGVFLPTTPFPWLYL